MREISDLLKEAKPLYYERKRIKNRVQKACLSVFILFTVLTSGYCGYTVRSLTTSDYIATTDINTTTETYYPTDEYGLITVAY